MVNAAENFETTIRPVLEEMRAAIAVVIERVTPTPRKKSELQRTLGIDTHLSWSMFSAAHAQDPLAVAALLPGKRAVGKFFDRALANGVSPEIVHRAKQAFVEFERAAQEQAGGREMFEAMVAGLNVSRINIESDTDLRNKRSAYRAMSMLWDHQARQFTECLLLHPSEKPDLVDRAFLSAIVGLRQNRPGSSITFRPIGSRLSLPGDPETATMQSLGENDPNREYPFGMIRELCSHSKPTFRTFTDEFGALCHELVHKTLGVTDEFTYVWGHVTKRGDLKPGSSPGAAIEYIRVFNLPCELHVTDIFIHESLWDDRLPEISVYEQDTSAQSVHLRESYRMALREHITFLGRGLDIARSPEISIQADMLAYAFHRLGWKPREFRVFRCRVQYPVIHTRLRIALKA